MQKLVQPGECELEFRLGCQCRHDAAALGLDSLLCVLKQRRLADSRFAADHQLSASVMQAIDETVEELGLNLARSARKFRSSRPRRS